MGVSNQVVRWRHHAASEVNCRFRRPWCDVDLGTGQWQVAKFPLFGPMSNAVTCPKKERGRVEMNCKSFDVSIFRACKRLFPDRTWAVGNERERSDVQARANPQGLNSPEFMCVD